MARPKRKAPKMACTPKISVTQALKKTRRKVRAMRVRRRAWEPDCSTSSTARVHTGRRKTSTPKA
jgi:hypothetical protein